MVIHVRRLPRFQNRCDDDICGHGTQVWSFDQMPRQPLLCSETARFQ